MPKAKLMQLSGLIKTMRYKGIVDSQAESVSNPEKTEETGKQMRQESKAQ